MTRLRFLRPLALLPATAVFAWIVGALPAGGSSAPAPAQQSAAPVIRDAWDVPVATHGNPEASMVAWADLPARVVPMSKADYERDREARANMPATKSGIAFVRNSYDDHVQMTVRKNRLRFTRLWYSRALAPEVPSTLLDFFPATGVACAEHTWAFAREHNVSFDVSATGASNLETDGPPALTECLTRRLADWKPPAKPNAKQLAGRSNGKVVLSFVVVKA